MLSLKNMINEAYALEASRKVKAIVQMNQRKGNFTGGIAPYGYFKHSDDCHKLVIDDYAGTVVRVIFEMAAAGKSHRAILDWLNESGHLPPRRYFYSIGLATENEVGAKKMWWGHGAISELLRNGMYCGDMVQGKHKTVNNEIKQVPQDEWVIVNDTHEAIISRELFDAVQNTLAKPDPAKQPYYKVPMTENVFQGKVRCGHCGYTMNRKRGGEKWYGYKCNTRLQYSPKACPGMKMPETALKTEMLRLMREYEPYLAKMLAPSSGIVSEVGNSQKELASVQSEFDRNKRFLEGLYESLVSGDISDSEYKDMKSTYEVKIASLTEQIKQLREEIHTRAGREAALSQAHANVQKLEQISDLTAEIVDRLVERITVHPNGRIEVKFSFLDEPVFNKEEGADNE
jgi:hypothetical protein